MSPRSPTGGEDAAAGSTADVVAPGAAPMSVPSSAPAPAPASPFSTRTLRQRIDDHPVGLFVGIVIAAVTATLGIVVPILQLTQDSRVAAVQAELAQAKAQEQTQVESLQAELDQAHRDAQSAVAEERARAQARVDELERSLSSITRSLGDGTDYYDVSQLVVDSSDASSIPETSKFDPADAFYALDPARATDWTSATISELRFTADLFGRTEDEVRAGQPANLIEALTRFPMHVWYYGADKVVTLHDPVSGNQVTLHPRTMATIQEVTLQEYIDFQVASLPANAAGAEDIIRAGFARDPAGWVLQDQLVSDITSSGSLRPRIESLQKRDDTAYGRAETVLPNVTIDNGGTQLPEYYWSREWLIVDSGTDLYLVKLFVADDDHRARDYAAVSTWLDDLRIVRS
jgi:hypothetical protein